MFICYGVFSVEVHLLVLLLVSLVLFLSQHISLCGTKYKYITLPMFIAKNEYDKGNGQANWCVFNSLDNNEP